MIKKTVMLLARSLLLLAPTLVLLLLTLALYITPITLADDDDDFDISMALVEVYTDEDGIAVTVYDLSLIPEGYLHPTNASAPMNTMMSMFKLPMLNMAFGNLDLHLDLIYDNAYHEKVLLPGKTLTAEVTADNSSADDDSVTLFVVTYTDENRLVSTSLQHKNVAAGTNEKIAATITVPTGSEVSKAKIFLWDSAASMTPYTAPVLLTLNSQDYFGDDYAIAQPLNAYSNAVGHINSEDDVDVFEYNVTRDGLYIFESYGDTDTYAELYWASDMSEPFAEDDNSGKNNNFRLSADLTVGEKYYLYVHGHQTGEYSIRAMYAIGNIIGTVSPVVYYDDDEQFNRDIEASVTLSTYVANEFSSAVYLSEWSKSDSSSASFDLMGIFGGEYLVKISRPGYLSRYQKIVLDDIDKVVNLGNKILLAGDVNGDGVIDSVDAALLQSKYNKHYGEAGYIIAADLNGDKIINSADLALLTPNLNRTANYYNENVNVITVKAVADNSVMTISGTAVPGSTVECTVEINGIIMYRENLSVNSSGNYQGLCNISKKGTYNITVTADNRAFDAVAAYSYN